MIGVTPQNLRALPPYGGESCWRQKLPTIEQCQRMFGHDYWYRPRHNSVFLHSANSLNLTLIGCDPKSAIAKLIGSLKRRGPMLPGLAYNTSSLVRMSG